LKINHVFKRYLEKEIEEDLNTSGVAVVAGPKWCGKTTTSERYAKSEYAIDTKAKIKLVGSDPVAILVGDNPRMIDEWQHVPELLNVAKTKIDHRENKFGQFIFTGSSIPADMSGIIHSGSGRIVTAKMRPMTLFESGDSTGAISLSSLLMVKRKCLIQTISTPCLRPLFIFATVAGLCLWLKAEKERF
jgi:predicted AAA+ superfamily ATPase